MPKAPPTPLQAALTPELWLTPAQIVEARPGLVERTIRTWCEEGLIPYTKRSTGQTAQRLFRLQDVDALLESLVTPATRGPLSGVKPATSGPLVDAS